MIPGLFPIRPRGNGGELGMTLKELRKLLEDFPDDTPVSVIRERLLEGVIFIGAFLNLRKD